MNVVKRKLGLIEIKPEMVTVWKSWGDDLVSKYRNEAIKTLEEEGLSQEHVFLIEIEDRTFLGYFTEGSFEPTNMLRELNQQHKRLLSDSTIKRFSGEELYSLASEIRN